MCQVLNTGDTVVNKITKPPALRVVILMGETDFKHIRK